jgi:hypothetical protein
MRRKGEGIRLGQKGRLVVAVRRLSSFAYRQGKQWGLFSLFGARRTNALICRYRKLKESL